jgi:hypothetical protein
VAFVNFNSDNKKVSDKSIELVDRILPEVAPAFFHGLIFTYADNTLYKKHRKMLGIKGSHVPAISINNNQQ